MNLARLSDRCLARPVPQQCRDSTDCHENGHCVVVDNSGYVCECLPGYRGDGIRQCVVAGPCFINVTRRTRPHAIRMPNVYTEKRSAHTSANVCEVSLETEFDVCLMRNPRRVVRSRVFVTLMLNVSSITKQTRLHACANQDLLVMEPIDVILRLVVIPHHIAVGLDYDCQDARFVWSDISGHSIKSASLNGTDMKSHYKKDLNSPEGVAVDWSSRNVYYADSLNDEIGVASLDGRYQKALITEGLVNPRALALDLNNKHLFYTDWHRENPIIGRVDMDGKNNRVFLNDDIHLPNGITILPKRRELCWVDAGNHRYNFSLEH
ncbi:Low-density lipoprotein receptor repeat class B [Teladorsagia circumcincta]|uniref:Low-density lipoprotein receptor repeat class B n=1 Tax=Teladorsagia circumcincta TaxID=45464 RepID=A0A2G9UJ41_TELCI|nr:Low-density lipoprotein receptor repeat class B [Teladorsagia circumcincta]